MSKIHIQLVDDHEVVRLGLKSLIENYDDYLGVAEAATEEEAVEQALAHKPDVILMDIRLGTGNGIKACEKIMKKMPDTKIVMLTSYAEDEMLFAALQAGAVGYILKQVGSNNIIRAIESAVKNEAVLDLYQTQNVFSEVQQLFQKDDAANFTGLNEKEMQVLALVSTGNTNREIADELFLSEGTIRNYVSIIFSKLQVANRAEAAAYAIRYKLKDYIPM
jgi:DNA-binding NarL/FixJ family response regulator